ncbi:MAG: WD40 repeat domain-containing protein [Promethearchaeota archaeon]
MRVIKDRTVKEVTNSEIYSISFDARNKYIAVGAFEEPVLIYRYPYMKLFKKISHRERVPIVDGEELNIDKKFLVEINGKKYKKGKILSPIKVIFSKRSPHLIVAYTNGDILIYNTQAWKKEKDLRLSESIIAIQLVDNGKLLFLITTWEITVIDTSNWKILRTKKIDDILIQKAILTDDYKELFIVSDKKRVKSINCDTLEENNVFKGHKSGINMIRLSPDEEIIGTCGNDGKISLFNAKNGEFLSYLIGHSDEVHSIEFSSNGKFLVSSSEDNTLRLWDILTYKCVKIIQNVPNSFDMKRYGELLVMGTVSGDIITFRIY